MTHISFDEANASPATIKVVGVGGAGMNAIDRIVALNLQHVGLIAVNTDAQVLNRSNAPHKCYLGEKLTRGMGAGANPAVGEEAALEDKDQIVELIQGTDMLFITAGMGGGTGTGAAPAIAQFAKDMGILTVGVVSMPFKAEGTFKSDIALEGHARLKQALDTLITIPNDSIFKLIDKKTSINLAFKALDDILARSVIGISDIVNSTGTLNVDFADVKTVMKQNGDAIIGVGEGSGDDRIAQAIDNAIHHPLLEERKIDGATSVLLNIVGGSDLSLHEYNQVLESLQRVVSKEAHIITGFREDSTMEDRLSVTVIATGFKSGDICRNAEQFFKHTNLQKNNATPTAKTHSNLPQKLNKNGKNQQDFDFSFPNIDPNDNLNIPTFLRKKQEN